MAAVPGGTAATMPLVLSHEKALVATFGLLITASGASAADHTESNQNLWLNYVGDHLFTSSESATVSGVELRVPALAHLIALKLHAAQNEHRVEKDLADIFALLRGNPGEIPAAELRMLCDQFGTPELAERLRDFL